MDHSTNRLSLSYLLEDGDTTREIEFPFVIGVLADFSGDQQSSRDAYWRGVGDFEEVTRRDLDRFLSVRRPQVAFDLCDPVSGTELLNVDLTFECLDDFAPARIAHRVETLKHLHDAQGLMASRAATLLRLIARHERLRQVHAAWRGLSYLLDRTAESPHVKVLALDVSKRNLLKSLQVFTGSAWDHSPLFTRIYRDRFGTLGGEPIGCLIGDYLFDQTPRDVEGLREVARVCAAAQCPFVSGLAPSFMHLDSWSRVGNRRDPAGLLDLPEYAPWQALRAHPDSRFLVMTLPRMSIETADAPLINASFAVGAALGGCFAADGSWSRIDDAMEEATRDLGPEAWLPPSTTRALSARGLTTLTTGGGRDAGVESSITSLAGEPLADVLIRSHFAHHVRGILRDKGDRFHDRSDARQYIERWLLRYVDGDPLHSSAVTKARLPLTSARAEVELDESNRSLAATLLLQLQGQVTAPVARIPDPRPGPRTVIQYSVESYGEEKKIALPFVIGFLADLSGDPGEPLPAVDDRRFLEIDADNFDARMKSMRPRVAFQVSNTLTGEGDLDVELTFESMDDFSPIGVARRLPDTRSLLEVREQLADLLVYLDVNPEAEQELDRLLHDPVRLDALATTPPSEDEASEPLRTFGLKTAEARSVVAEALHQLAATAVTTPPHPGQEASNFIAAAIRRTDDRLNEQVNAVMHHPDFQRVERTWYGLRQLVGQTAADDMVKVRVMNITKQEMGTTLQLHSGSARAHFLFWRLHEEAYRHIGGEPVGCLVGDYYFDRGLQDVELLSHLATICAAAHCPFIAGASPALMQMSSWQELPYPRDLGKIFTTPEYVAWHALRARDEARFLVLAMPRFLARRPWADCGDAGGGFCFAEVVDDPEHYAWANSATAVGMVIARALVRYSWPARIAGVETGGTLSGPVPAAPEGDLRSAGVRVTEAAISERRVGELAACGLVPLVGRLFDNSASFIEIWSMHKPGTYGDPDADRHAALGSQLPYVLSASRFVHYLECIARDGTGSWQNRDDMQAALQSWIMDYVDADPHASSQWTKARKPLAAAEVDLVEIDDNPESYLATFYLRPHYQLSDLFVSLRLTSELPAVARRHDDGSSA